MIATAPEPKHPEIVVELTPQRGRSLATIALVRRALQKAGYPEDAHQWADQALASEPNALLNLARDYVTVT